MCVENIKIKKKRELEKFKIHIFINLSDYLLKLSSLSSSPSPTSLNMNKTTRATWSDTSQEFIDLQVWNAWWELHLHETVLVPAIYKNLFPGNYPLIGWLRDISYFPLCTVCCSHRSCQATPLLPPDGVWWGEGGHRGRHWDRDGHPVPLPTRGAVMLLFVCWPKHQHLKTHNPWNLYTGHATMQVVSLSLTSVQGSETELSVSVQLLQTWWSGTGMKHVVLLVPWSLIVKRQLTLYIQVRHRWDERGERVDGLIDVLLFNVHGTLY